MSSSNTDAAQKFDTSRADEYETQSRIALAGYDACHDLAACMLSAALAKGRNSRILVVGAGGGAREIVTAGPLQPNWHFTAVDPSEPMMQIAVDRVQQAGLMDRTTIHLGYLDTLPDREPFDAATLIGVLHHLRGDDAKHAMLDALGTRLKPGAPLILACNHYAYADQPLLLSAWGERWRMHGETDDQIKQKLGKILQGADPPHSEAAVAALLSRAGFDMDVRFFSSLFWSAWLARRRT